MSGRAGAALGLVAVAALALGALAFDASVRRADAADRDAAMAALARATGSVDLALSSGARWLRHPTSAEPAAGCAAPTCLDTDPAGLALPPPRATFAAPGDRTLVRVPEARP